MANPWFRFYHEFATDPKVQMLSEINQRRFVMVLCLRCSNGDETLHDETVAFQLRIKLDEWTQTKAVLIEQKLIDKNNKPTNWGKRQYISDTSTARVKVHREKMKQACNVSVTPPDTDTDTEKDKRSTSLSGKADAIPYQKIIELYHKALPELPAVAKLTAKRKAQIRQRFKEDMGELHQWENFFEFVSRSDFLMGRVQPTNGRAPFRADIEWLTNQTNFTKIAEDKYH